MAVQPTSSAPLITLCLVLVIILGLLFNYYLAHGATFVCRLEMKKDISVLNNPLVNPEYQPRTGSVATGVAAQFGSQRYVTLRHETTKSPTLLPTDMPSSPQPTQAPSVTPRISYFGLQSEFNRERLQVFKRDSCHAHLRDLVFVHIPKTGGETVEKILGLQKNHYNASARKVKDPCWDSKFKFTVVRNPWDRMLSFYFHLRKSLDETNRYYHHPMNPLKAWKLATSLPFNKWIETVLVNKPKSGVTTAGYDLLASAHDYLFSKTDDILVDYVARFENIEQDMKRLFQMVGRPGLRLPKMNASKRKRDYHSYYNKKSIAIVRKAFAKDVSIFNYTY